MSYERLKPDHPDIEDRDRGGPLPKEDRTEVKRCFTALTETHAPPLFKLYESTDDKAVYDYYALATNNTTRIFGFDEAEYLATISAMESTPLIVEHRSPGGNESQTSLVTTR
jgi:hypothetical protein